MEWCKLYSPSKASPRDSKWWKNEHKCRRSCRGGSGGSERRGSNPCWSQNHLCERLQGRFKQSLRSSGQSGLSGPVARDEACAAHVARLTLLTGRWITPHSLENQNRRPGLRISPMKTRWRHGTLPFFQPTALKVDHFQALFSTAWHLSWALTTTTKKTHGHNFSFCLTGPISDHFS